MERITNLAACGNERFDKTDYEVYVTRTGENSAWDYALIDEDNLIIIYIYMESVLLSEIEFNHDLLPEGYSGYGEIE